MKKNSAIYACTTAIVILLASLIGCDCVTATDWGFGPIQPEAAEVESANVMAMKTPSPGPQEVVCENGVCRIVETVPASTWVSPATATCPCGCGIAGCNCTGGAAMVYSTTTIASPRMSWLASHLTSDHGINVAGMSESQMEAIHDSLHGGGYGVFGLRSGPAFVRGGGYGLFGIRAKPWGWRIRAFFGR